jgi:hypothetical protein
LIHLDDQGPIRLHWSPMILDELSRALADTGRKPDAESARRHEHLMRAALPQAETPTQRVQTRFASVAPAMRSTKDTHVTVCAAAILADGFYPDTQAVSLVTKNTRDFGIRKLAAFGIAAQRPARNLGRQLAIVRIHGASRGPCRRSKLCACTTLTRRIRRDSFGSRVQSIRW